MLGSVALASALREHCRNARNSRDRGAYSTITDTNGSWHKADDRHVSINGCRAQPKRQDTSFAPLLVCLDQARHRAGAEVAEDLVVPLINHASATRPKTSARRERAQTWR